LNATQDLLEASDRIRRALLDNDADALRQLVADDYSGIGPDGDEHDRAVMLQAYGPGGVRLDNYETRDVTTRIVGDVGLVMGVGTLSGRHGDHRFEHRLRFLDVYVYRGSTWLLSVSQVTALRSGE
jgi:hypothetical protein